LTGALSRSTRMLHEACGESQAILLLCAAPGGPGVGLGAAGRGVRGAAGPAGRLHKGGTGCVAGRLKCNHTAYDLSEAKHISAPLSGRYTPIAATLLCVR